jgi:hypothetical protein
MDARASTRVTITLFRENLLSDQRSPYASKPRGVFLTVDGEYSKRLASRCTPRIPGVPAKFQAQD